MDVFESTEIGLILYPIGWHTERGVGNPGLSTTIRGAVGFLINITSPTCLQRFNDGDTVRLSGMIETGGMAPFVWRWISSVDGDLGNAQNISKVLFFPLGQWFPCFTLLGSFDWPPSHHPPRQ